MVLENNKREKQVKGVVAMSRIITIGREFGSGGRELGRRLAEELADRIL